MYQLLLYRHEYSLAHCSALFPTFFFLNLFVLWDAFMICNYIPAKLLNFFFNHLKVWLPYCLRKFLWTSLSTAPDFEKKKKKKGNRELWKAKASLSYVLDMGMTCFFLTMPVCLHKMLDHYAYLLSCCLSGFYKNMEALHFFTGWHEWSSNLGYWDFFYGL